jgi:arylsulfatase A-like enzyme
MGHVDTLATLAALTGQQLPAAAGPDSYNVLPALLGQKNAAPQRDHLVLQNNNPAPLALRQGDWVLIEKPRRPQAMQAAPRPELYNLATDLAQTNNLVAQQPARVNEMTLKLEQLRKKGYSRPQWEAN